jgi:hypothetical protein
MDSQEAKKDNFELPSPTASLPEAAALAPEKGQVHEQKTTAAPADPAAAAASPAADPAAVTGATAALAASVSASTQGLAAEDADLIEKTWVEKAKQIVAETRGDPYTQNKEINKVKADYIKKRYNKDIKLAGE